MAITKLKSHDKCPVKAIKGPFGPHFGRLICNKHHKHIQFLSETDFIKTVKILGKFENNEGIIFDKRDIKNAQTVDNFYIVKDGIKERSNRQKPKQIKMQRKYGNCWNTEYSF